MTANSVEKHFFLLLNVDLQMKIRLKTFFRLTELLYTAFVIYATTITNCFANFFSYPWNYRIICEP